MMDKKGKGGRPPTGNHRKYFQFSVDGKTAICQISVACTPKNQMVIVIDDNGEGTSATAVAPESTDVRPKSKICGVMVKGANSPTNLKSHIQHHHKEIWNALSAENASTTTKKRRA